MLSQRIVNPELMWFILIAGAFVCCLLLPFPQALSLGISGWVLLIIVGSCWTVVVFKGLVQHRQAIRSVAGIDHIVTNGLYKYCRHPLYAADIVMAWTTAIAINSLLVFSIALWFTLILLTWAKLEEKGLEEKFGQIYRDYKRATPTMIPRLHKGEKQTSK